MAAKPKYSQDRVARICEALSRGETDIVAAEMGGVSPSTFYEWQNTKPEFSEAVKKAKEEFERWELNDLLTDAKRGLKTLIMGMEYEEVKSEYLPDPDDHDKPKIHKQTRTKKRIPPSATAIIFALCNRDPENWKNRVSQEVTGKLETEAKSDISLKNVPDELLAQVIDCIRGK